MLTTGRRLFESTFHYANSLAIYLLVSLLISLMFYMKEKRVSYFLFISINSLGLLLTLSRSVWVIWFVSIVIVLTLFKEARNGKVFINVALAHIVSFVGAMMILQNPLFFWERAKSIQPATSEFHIRLVYWKDSIALIRDHLWGGTGGGGWNVLLPYYRSQYYYVKFIHNHYIQVLLDIGLIGLLVFLALITIHIINFLKGCHGPHAGTPSHDPFWAKAGLLVICCLLFHAGFDFDFSFPLLFGWFIVLVSIGSTGSRSAFKKIKLAYVLPIIICSASVVVWLNIRLRSKNRRNKIYGGGRRGKRFAEISNCKKDPPLGKFSILRICKSTRPTWECDLKS